MTNPRPAVPARPNARRGREDEDDMAGKVRIKFAMEFEFPDKLSSGDRKRIAQLAADVAYLNGVAENPDGVDADRHHFADAVDAIRTLASVVRRARATE